MTRPYVALLLLSVLLTGCKGETSPQSPTPPSVPPTTYTVSGLVTLANGTPVADALVVVADPSPNPNAGKSTRSAANGSYSLPGLTFAGFSFEIVARGHVDASRGIILTEGKLSEAANFVVTPITPVQFAGLGANTTPYRGHSESGITVTPTRNSWRHIINGVPGPAVAFTAPSAAEASPTEPCPASGAAPNCLVIATSAVQSPPKK